MLKVTRTLVYIGPKAWVAESLRLSRVPSRLSPAWPGTYRPKGQLGASIEEVSITTEEYNPERKEAENDSQSKRDPDVL